LDTSITTATITSAAADTIPPTVTITSNISTLTSGLKATLTFTFSEKPVGFDINDITVAGGTLSALTVDSTGLVYSATLTPTVTTGKISVNVASGYFDAAGNLGAAASLDLTASTAPGVAHGAAVAST
jgi:hypothetical protein